MRLSRAQLRALANLLRCGQCRESWPTLRSLRRRGFVTTAGVVRLTALGRLVAHAYQDGLDDGLARAFREFDRREVSLPTSAGIDGKQEGLL